MLPVVLIPWLTAATVGAAGVAAGYLYKGAGQAAKPVTNSLKAWSRFDDFSLLLAISIFLIDGELSREEERYLDELRSKAPNESWYKISEALKEPNLFAVLSRWYRALDEADARQVEPLLSELVRVDSQVAEEEIAFLVQFSQVVDGNEPLDLYVSRSSVGAAPQHDLFRYINKDAFTENFPDSECVYREGMLYVEHPFLHRSLQRFSAEDFSTAQEAMYEGLIGLMKDLGAKKVELLDYLEESDRAQTSASAGAELAAGMGPAKIDAGAKAGRSVSADDLMRKENHLVVTFEGLKPRWVDRLLQRRWRSRLMKKYESNKQYRMIIDGRFGENRIKTFSFQLKSVDARKLVKAINASANLQKKVVKAGIQMDVKSDDANVCTVEKVLKIDFY
ncbi:MAG: hypothetical protein KF800_14475 [Lysobacter sp.]|nr:hypothetical protein [Lysobacter sp.]